MAKLKVRPLRQEYNTSNMSDSLVEWSVSYAIEAEDFVGGDLTNIQYLVLQAALLLTITLPQYLSPSNGNDSFTIIMGISGLCHIFVILMSTSLVAAIVMPFGSIDSHITRAQFDWIFILIQVVNYIGDLLLLVGLVISGFNSSSATESYTMLVATSVAFISALVISLYMVTFHGFRMQAHRAILFYKKYCIACGLLKPAYLAKIYGEKNENLMPLSEEAVTSNVTRAVDERVE